MKKIPRVNGIVGLLTAFSIAFVFLCSGCRYYPTTPGPDPVDDPVVGEPVVTDIPPGIDKKME